MKTFAIILVLGLAVQVSKAYLYQEECLLSNGFNYNDMPIVEGIGLSNYADDALKDYSKDDLAAAVACLLSKYHKSRSLYDTLKFLTKMDDAVTPVKRHEMIDILNKCNSRAENDSDLLRCVKFIDPPFNYLIAIMRDLREEALPLCYDKCELMIPDLFTIEIFDQNIKELLSRLGENKLYCVTACRLNQEDNPKEIIYDVLSAAIDKKVDFSEDTRTEMKYVLDGCFSEIIDYESEKNVTSGIKLDESLQMIKCIQLFKTPFLYLHKI